MSAADTRLIAEQTLELVALRARVAELETLLSTAITLFEFESDKECNDLSTDAGEWMMLAKASMDTQSLGS